MTSPVRFTVNGRSVSLADSGERTLLWALRTDLDLTGPKYGCGEGHCGACTVLVDGEAQRSCSVALSSVAGKTVTTIEGLAQEGKLHPVQQAFIDHGAFQCGYCTSGMILTAVALLKETPHPTREQIVSGMDHNYCRCAAYQRIVAAIQSVGGAA